jgi:methyltransferase
MGERAFPPEFAALLAVVALERLAELSLSRRHLSRTQRGAPAAGRPGDFVAMVSVHVALLLLPALEVALCGARGPRAARWTAIGVFLLAQGLRYWAIASLGRAWNVRAVVDPALGVVTRGPYRWIRHPNYLAVLLEFVAIPAAGGAWTSLLVLNLLHAPLLARRIRDEEALLSKLPGYDEAMAGKGRFFPRLRPRSPSLSP